MLKIAVLGGVPRSLVNFRGALLRSLRNLGLDVVAGASGSDAEVSKMLSDDGIKYCPLQMNRVGLNPLGDMLYLMALRNWFIREQPQVVFAYTHKPIIYSGLAIQLVSGSIKMYPLVTGLGYAFSGEYSVKRALAETVMRRLYKMASRSFSGILFQNPDDRDHFVKLKMIRDATPRTVVRGSGVDLELFKDGLLTARPRGTLKFVLIARLLAEKGVREYVSAAEAVKKANPCVEFHLVGPIDSNPSAIGRDEVGAWEKSGIIIYHGSLKDVRPILQLVDVFVLPSNYREGTPRTVLEAMSMGRPVITTDEPGCRETVFDLSEVDDAGVRVGRNGFLVAGKSVEALVSAMRRLIEDPALAVRMGAEGRRLAEEYYDVHKVNAQIMHFMGIPQTRLATTSEKGPIGSDVAVV